MIFTSQTIKGYTLQLTLTETARSVADNATTLNYHLALCSTGTRFSDYGVGATLKLNGAAVASRDRYTQPRLSIGYNSSLTLLSGSLTVPHEADGTKTVAVAFSIDMAADDWTPGPVSVSGKSMTLTPIARESTAAATDGIIGGVSVITVNRKNAAYTHTLHLQFGAISGYIGQNWQLSDAPYKLTDTGIAFTIPENFYYEIPNSPYGQCKLTVTTYQGNEIVGSQKVSAFRVQADPASKPDVSFSVADANEKTLALTGDHTKLVRFFSTPEATVTATGKFGATIAQKTVEGIAFTGESLLLPAAEGDTFAAAVTDSRGFTATANAACSLIPYCKLTAVGSYRRPDPTGDVILTVSGNCFTGSFGLQDNSLNLTCSVNGESLPMTPQMGENGYVASLTLSGLDYQKSHSLVITAQDALMTVTKTVTVKQGIPVFDWGEKDFAFHVPVDLNGVFIRKVRVWDGKRSFYFQSKFTAFGQTVSGRQPVLLCGTANSNHPVLGLLVIDNTGTCTWTGTGEITAQKADEQGGITVTLPNGAYDDFLTITMI